MSNVLVALPGPALAAVQEAVQSAAVTLGWPAGVVDREFNQLACSNGAAPTGSPTQLAARVRQAGGFTPLGQVWLPADPAMAMPATVWVPVRCDGRLLGFLWLMHPGTSLSHKETERARLAVREIANALRHTNTGNDLLIQELLGTDPHARQQALHRVLQEQPHAANLGITALVVVAGPGLRSQNLADMAREYPFRLVTKDHICVLIPGRSSNLDTIAGRLAAQTAGVAGIGQWYPHLRFAHDSYREALCAARAAARLTDLGPVVRWTALGVYRAFAHLPERTLPHSSIHPALEQLFTEPAHQQLLVTLETYLDLAGNVPQAAQQLHLHRASLYYRLRRIQQLLQADLHDGHQRLCLHIAFKLGRFTGRYPLPRPTTEASKPSALIPHR